MIGVRTLNLRHSLLNLDFNKQNYTSLAGYFAGVHQYSFYSNLDFNAFKDSLKVRLIVRCSSSSYFFFTYFLEAGIWPIQMPWCQEPVGHEIKYIKRRVRNDTQVVHILNFQRLSGYSWSCGGRIRALHMAIKWKWNRFYAHNIIAHIIYLIGISGTGLVVFLLPRGIRVKSFDDIESIIGLHTGSNHCNF